MQIFACDYTAEHAAQALDDSRVGKMAVEACQILSAAVRHRVGDAEGDRLGLYKKPPSGRDLWLWASEVSGNYGWLLRHARMLNELDPAHRADRILNRLDRVYPYEVFGGYRPRTPFVNRCKSEKHGIDLTGRTDVVEAYREYLNQRWALERPKWANRKPPVWFIGR